MKVVMDLEANGLKPTKIWVVVMRDIDTDEVHTFVRPDLNPQPFLDMAAKVKLWVGHNFLAYDLPHANRLIPGLRISPERVIDTLVVSRLLYYRRPGGHSLRQYGIELGEGKVVVEDNQWDEFSDLMVERCVQDTVITKRVYDKYRPYIYADRWRAAMRTEHFMATLCVELHDNGFYFQKEEGEEFLTILEDEVQNLDSAIREGFPPRLSFIKEVEPRFTKHGTLSIAQFKWHPTGDLTEYNGGPFSRLEWKEFNPGSHIDRIDRLWEAGWQPEEKSQGHLDFIKSGVRDADKKAKFDKYGWKVSEKNLATLPQDAPNGARSLARRIVVANRASTLRSWLALVQPDGRIHGHFNGIGAWTHRMSHDDPNTANIPKFNSKRPETTLYSDRMRGLWTAAPNCYLVGVDAESIQLRVLGHLINDKEFIASLVSGSKAEGTDPHSLNMRKIGSVCKSRDDAKNFIYAWILNAQANKLASMLGCLPREAKAASKRFLDSTPGLKVLKEDRVKRDAQRGFFEGLDGRYVRCFGDDVGAREHFMVAGYLQNGEKIVMARGAQIWYPQLKKERIPYRLVNFVHDEYQLETPRDLDIAVYVAQTVAKSLAQAGEELGLNCPMAGSYLGDHGVIPVDPSNPEGPKYAIGDTWMQTH